MRQIKVAVIGAGLMAGHHINAFADVEGVSVVGIYSRTRARTELLAISHGVPSVFDSIDELYLSTRADLVIVAVSELSVNAVCKEVFAYPWQVLIEKPPGYNLKDAEDIAATAVQCERTAYVALNRRHYSSTRAVLEELKGITERRLVQVFDQEDPVVALQGGTPQQVVENWMYANSIHTVDYFSVFCRGKIVDVEHVIKWNPVEPSFVVSKIEYSSGDIGLYTAVWNGPGPWLVAVTTQAKRWEMRPLEQATSQLHKSRKCEPLRLHSWDTQFKPGLRLQAEEAVKAVRGESHSLPTLADGIVTMQLVSKIYEA